MEQTPQRSYAVAGISGTVGAALAANSVVFAMLASPTAELWAYLEQIRLSFTTIVAFGTPVTAGRRLGVYRATGGVAATGGTALGVVKKKGASVPASVITDVRIAAAAALGVAGIVRDADPLIVMDLVHVGAAGARTEFVYEYKAPKTPHAILPGELLVVSNPAAMDAAGTWQLGVTVDWRDGMPRH